MSCDRLIIALTGILPVTLLSACGAMPARGDRFVMVVTRIPKQAAGNFQVKLTGATGCPHYRFTI